MFYLLVSFLEVAFHIFSVWGVAFIYSSFVVLFGVLLDEFFVVGLLRCLVFSFWWHFDLYYFYYLGPPLVFGHPGSHQPKVFSTLSVRCFSSSVVLRVKKSKDLLEVDHILSKCVKGKELDTLISLLPVCFKILGGSSHVKNQGVFISDISKKLSSGNFKFSPYTVLSSISCEGLPSKFIIVSQGSFSDILVSKSLEFLFGHLWGVEFSQNSNFSDSRLILSHITFKYRFAYFGYSGFLVSASSDLSFSYFFSAVGLKIGCPFVLGLVTSFFMSGYFLEGVFFSVKLFLFDTPLMRVFFAVLLFPFDCQMQQFVDSLFKGQRRPQNNSYNKLHMKINRLLSLGFSETSVEVKVLREEMRSLSAVDVLSLKYIRAAYSRCYTSVVFFHSSGDLVIFNEFLSQVKLLLGVLGLSVYSSMGSVSLYHTGLLYLGVFLLNPVSSPSDLVLASASGYGSYEVRAVRRMRVMVPFGFLYVLLCSQGFISKEGPSYAPQPLKFLRFCSHSDILFFYQQYLVVFEGYYSACYDRVDLSDVYSLMYGSCALTLSLKYSCSLESVLFNCTSGLVCPVSGVSFYSPSPFDTPGHRRYIESSLVEYSQFEKLFVFSDLDNTYVKYSVYFCCVCFSGFDVKMYTASSVNFLSFSAVSLSVSLHGGSAPFCFSCFILYRKSFLV